jgi:3-hydroxyacyl-CoA dehydrogenase/enoyl-CoA hydratase/3-hydroxybutyryl-CoA epimerase/3-hydroxyacyl-CoA dehydrogenase/enoyl-CoA hydratase/3-hydroxybutyryl-CoA epimerase/enoyl-CoA isomerase
MSPSPTPAATTDVRVEYPENGVAVLVMDTVGKSANVLSRAFQDSLSAAIDEVAERPELRSVILMSAKPRIFVAGADLTAIVDHLDWSDEEIIEFCHFGRRLYQRLQEGPWTSVAAIQGACVGGGLELALGCDYRVAVDDPKPLFGLPETKLGLIPGWAATVRLPRMMDLDQAIGLITSGRLFPAREALSLGLVDQLVLAAELMEAALRMAADPARRAARSARRSQVLGPALTRVDAAEVLCREWRERVQSERSIWPFAPEVLARHMIESAAAGFEEACQSEARAMAVVWGSPPSHGLINYFFLGEHNRRQPGADTGNAAPRPIQTLGIVGCGVMGQAIARLAAEKRATVRLFDHNPAIAQTTAAALSGKAEAVAGLDGLAGCDLVIEAVPELPQVKLEVLRRLEDAVPETALIATNTSTLPVGELATGLKHPVRFCGIHFCHPSLLELVELVPGERTEAATLASAIAWVRGLDKTPVVVRDQPGFVVNRLLPGLVEAALALVTEGHGLAAVDAAMRATGMTGGPFEMMDEIGLDTLLNGGRAMAQRDVPGRFISPILPRMVKHGRLGRKCGRGFYRWDGSAMPRIDPESLALLADCLGPTRVTDETAVRERVLVELLLRATGLLDAGAVRDPRDIDLCLIRGLGFPAQLGGILFWADQTGPAGVQRLLGRHVPVESTWPLALTTWLNNGRPFFYPHGTRTGPAM